MSYAPTWTNANAQGRVQPAEHWVCLSDAEELADAVNRRRRLVYLDDQSYSFDEDVTTAPTTSFRQQMINAILTPAPGGLGGEPPTPSSMEWLWPVADGDENKIIVPSSPGEGEVSLFAKLNGTGTWTDASLAGGAFVRAVHANELRQAVEWLRRGRWTLPIYFTAGIISVLPNTCWIGELVANNGTDELRTVGFALFRWGSSPVLGLTNVTARASSCLELTADEDCTLGVYRCKRSIDFEDDPPTWNDYAPNASLSWETPGGLGGADAESIGTVELTAEEPGTVSGVGVQSSDAPTAEPKPSALPAG